MQEADLSDKRQSKARTFFTCVGMFERVKAIHHAGQRILGDTGTCVRHMEGDLSIGRGLSGKVDGAVGRCKVQGILDEVGEGLGDQETVPKDRGGGVFVDRAIERDATFLGLRQETFGDLGKKLFEVDGFVFFERVALFESNEIQETLDDIV